MKDFLGVLLIILFAFGVIGLIVLLGYKFSYVELTLIGLIISTIGIILFIKYMPGESHKPDEKGSNKF